MQEHPGGAAERRLAGHQLIKHDPEAVDVAPTVGPMAVAAGLLGRDVGGRAEDLALQRQGALVPASPGQAEVGDVGAAVAVDQDVRRLEVAVDDPSPMGVVDGPGDRQDQAGRLAGRDRPVLEPAGQGRAVDVLADEVAGPVDPAGVVDGDDPGVPEPGAAAGLAEEPLDLARRPRVLRPRDLQRDDPPELPVDRPVDDAERAAAGLLDQLEPPEAPGRGPDGDRSIGCRPPRRRWRPRWRSGPGGPPRRPPATGTGPCSARRLPARRPSAGIRGRPGRARGGPSAGGPRRSAGSRRLWADRRPSRPARTARRPPGPRPRPRRRGRRATSAGLLGREVGALRRHSRGSHSRGSQSRRSRCLVRSRTRQTVRSEQPTRSAISAPEQPARVSSTIRRSASGRPSSRAAIRSFRTAASGGVGPRSGASPGRRRPDRAAPRAGRRGGRPADTAASCCTCGG